ncbi:MAG: TIGR04283 family arsenosugar biosynthesis glycosyltransferase [Deltaproteobacteria bacterium]|nr:TIGR04283 family arsenosugar biosynthesis glycosyltransferase [Deltaproteobacteria bacterium]
MRGGAVALGAVRGIIRFSILALFIIIVILIYYLTPLGSYIRPEDIRVFIQSFGFWAPFVYILIYSIAPSLLLPGSVISLAGGLAFGGLYGTAYTLIGATIGASLAFFLARVLGREFAEGLLKGRLKTFDEEAVRHGFKVILFLRLVPIFPFNGINFGAGLSGIRFRDYLIATAIGIIPGTFAYVYLGSSLTSIGSPRFIFAVFLLLVLSTIPFIYKRLKRVENSECRVQIKTLYSPTKVSVIIPTLNEGMYIEETLIRVQSSECRVQIKTLNSPLSTLHSPPEVIVVDGGSKDDTLMRVKSSEWRTQIKTLNSPLSALHSQLSTLHSPKVYITTASRGGQMDMGVRESSGDVLLFLHADTRLPEGWLGRIEALLKDGDVVGGAFCLGIDSPRRSLQFIAWIANLRAKFLGLIYGDQAIFVRRDVFFKVGGFNGLPIMEDVDLVRRLRRIGKVVLIDSKVFTSSRRWDRGGVVFTTLRNWWFLILYYLGVSPWRLYRWYYPSGFRGQGECQRKCHRVKVS